MGDFQAETFTASFCNRLQRRRLSFVDDAAVITECVLRKDHREVEDKRSSKRMSLPRRGHGLVIGGIVGMGVFATLCVAVACGIFLGLLAFRPMLLFQAELHPAAGSADNLVILENYADGTSRLYGTIVVNILIENLSKLPVQLTWSESLTGMPTVIYLALYGASGLDDFLSAAEMLPIAEIRNTLNPLESAALYPFLAIINITNPDQQIFTTKATKLYPFLSDTPPEGATVQWQCEQGSLIFDITIPQVNWFTVAGLAGLRLVRGWPVIVPCVVSEQTS